MITRLEGKLKQKKDNAVVVDVGGISYEIWVPRTVMKEIESSATDGVVSFVTYHYHQLEPSRSVPILIGFSNEVEREFFEKFITVSGVGPKAAVKALAFPISTIAQAIDAGDIGVLKSMPGIGEQRARDIIAKLQGKVGRYGLIQDGQFGEEARPPADIEAEAMDVLVQLQYKKAEAKDMVKKAFASNQGISTTEELLNEVYRQKTVTRNQ